MQKKRYYFITTSRISDIDAAKEEEKVLCWRKLRGSIIRRDPTLKKKRVICKERYNIRTERKENNQQRDVKKEGTEAMREGSKLRK